MAETFYSILTSIGKAKIANAAGLGAKIDFVKMKVGDGNGSYYNPTESQTDLVHTVWQGNINQVAIDEDNPNWINIEVLIPPSDGGFFIREYGVFDSDGNMLAIAKCAETYKPLPSDGGTKEITMKMVLAISNTSSVTLKIDPTVIFAKKSEVEIVQNQVNSIKSEVENARGTYENLEARLDHSDTQLSDIAQDVIKRGLKGDGTDETTAFQSLVNNVGTRAIIIPEGKTIIIDTVTIARNNFIIFNYGTLKILNRLTFTGENSGIVGGEVVGNLKVGVVSSDVAIGSTVINLESNPFSVGDTVYIRGVLGNLDGTITYPKVIAVSGNTITVDTPTENYIATAGSYVCNYSEWEPSLVFENKKHVLDNCQLSKGQGYIMSVKGTLYANKISIDNNGLDSIALSGTLYLKDSYIGFSYADSTQGISLDGDNISLFVKRCYFNRNNVDADILVWGSTTVDNLVLKDTSFYGYYDSSVVFRPSTQSKAVNATKVVDFNNHDTTAQHINNLHIDNCIAKDYTTALMTTYGISTAQYTIDKITVVNSLLEDCGFVDICNTTTQKFVFDNCIIQNIDNTYSTTHAFNTLSNWNGVDGLALSPLNGILEINNCTIKDIKGINLRCYNIEVNNSKIIRCSTIRGTKLLVKNSEITLEYSGASASYAKIMETTENGLVFENCKLIIDVTKYPSIPSSMMFSGIMKFKVNSSLYECYAYTSYTSSVPYLNLVFAINTTDGSLPTLSSELWYMPVNTVIKNLAGVTQKTVTYSAKKTILSTTVGDTVLRSSTSVTDIAVGDYVNIPLSTGKCFTATVASVDTSLSRIVLASAPTVATVDGQYICVYRLA